MDVCTSFFNRLCDIDSERSAAEASLPASLPSTAPDLQASPAPDLQASPDADSAPEME